MDKTYDKVGLRGKHRLRGRTVQITLPSHFRSPSKNKNLQWLPDYFFYAKFVFSGYLLQILDSTGMWRRLPPKFAIPNAQSRKKDGIYRQVRRTEQDPNAGNLYFHTTTSGSCLLPELPPVGTNVKPLGRLWGTKEKRRLVLAWRSVCWKLINRNHSKTWKHSLQLFHQLLFLIIFPSQISDYFRVLNSFQAIAVSIVFVLWLLFNQ